MGSLFSQIIAGEMPARFVYADPTAVAFLTIEPLRPGHTLVVPRREVDHWVDLPAEDAAHLFEAARQIGLGVQRAFHPSRVALLVLGFNVAHVHLHVVGLDSEAEADFARADRHPRAADLDEAAERLRTALRELRVAGVTSAPG